MRLKKGNISNVVMICNNSADASVPQLGVLQLLVSHYGVTDHVGYIDI